MGSVAQAAREQRHVIHGLKPTVTIPAAAQQSSSRSRATGASETEERIAKYADVSEALCSDSSGAVYGDVNEAQGDLYLLTNLSTLGSSEEEILFHLRHAALGHHQSGARNPGDADA